MRHLLLHVSALVALAIFTSSGRQHYSVTFENACHYPIVPEIVPGYEQNDTDLVELAPGMSVKYTFPKKGWYGMFTASKVGATFAGHAEVDLTTGRYNLVMPNTTPDVQHKLTLSVSKKKRTHVPTDTCSTATCDRVGCKDAYLGSTGLLQAADRPNGNTTMPNHICRLDDFKGFILKTC